jgi:hypothetical protein
MKRDEYLSINGFLRIRKNDSIFSSPGQGKVPREASFRTNPTTVILSSGGILTMCFSNK